MIQKIADLQNEKIKYANMSDNRLKIEKLLLNERRILINKILKERKKKENTNGQNEN